MKLEEPPQLLAAHQPLKYQQTIRKGPRHRLSRPRSAMARQTVNVAARSD
jgi:hypothetical protein